MALVNEHFLKLPGSYLFSDIAKKIKVLIYISTLENHRKAGVGKSPNQSFLFI